MDTHDTWATGFTRGAPVCTENSVRIDYVTEAPNVTVMIALFCLVLALRELHPKRRQSDDRLYEPMEFERQGLA